MNIEHICEKLLEFMRAKDYAPLTLPELGMRMKFGRKDLLKLKKAISDLMKAGTIARVKGDKFGLSSELDLVSGTIDFRPSGRAFMRVGGGALIEFRPEDTSVALNGDKVLARISVQNFSRMRDSRGSFGKKRPRSFYEKPSVDDNKKYGKVIRILERKNAKVVGTLRRSYNFWHVVPDDPKFFYDVIVGEPSKSAATPVPEENDKVVVRLNEWQQRHMNPTGEILENLGQSHTPMAEYRAILTKYELSETFPPSVVEETDDIPQEVSKKDIDSRCDMRGKFTITIDPEDAKDFDDAISLEKNSAGEWEVGVHIADVSHYVRAGSAIDKEALARGNSTYLVGTVIPMLPFELSNGICSLVEDKDRLVKSVFLIYDQTGDCKSVRFANSVIRSVKRLTYEQAHALLEHDNLERIIETKPPENYETAFSGKSLGEMPTKDLQTLKVSVRKLWEIAQTLRKKRMRKGSFDLNVPEFKIFCDKDGYADRIEKIEYNESHQLIEEFMLAANEAVSRELFSHHIPYVSRVHDDPDADKLEELREDLLPFGIACGDLTSRREILKVLAQISVHPQSYFLKTKFLRSLKRAEYRAEPDGHYGLNKIYYAHFTSPIRRYADLTVHRAIAFLMKSLRAHSATKSAQMTPKAVLDGISEHITKTEQNSTEAERESRKIKLMEFFERGIGSGESYEAVVTSVSNHGFFVELTESMAYGFVHVHTMHDDIYRLNDDATELKGKSSGTTIHIGDKVAVEVESVDRFKRQIDFHLAQSARRDRRRRNRR